ncbi:tenascin-like isoform X2 [Salmo salar]|uniref:Tenascin-like isoform X2 n=1 Tax=Salmo salar TaxID=8030 RepID=A0A1S3KY87_SALSA|nr:tenascin-like isoform X2 [Salmo salar]
MGTKSFLGCVFLTLLLNLCQAGLVRKLLRHKRATLTTPGGNNVTLTSADQPVVFNHVYNINVPSGSLCSVDLDALGSTSLKPQDAAPPSGLRTTEHTLDGQNQIVFTHRINIPQQECACTDGLPDLKDLLSRLEMLEGEVSTLRDQCASGDAGCCSVQPVTGEVGTKPYCNGRGNYSADTCGCICEPGWKGPNCTESECPNNCQDQGRCVDGKCVCFEGFGRDDCSLKVCKVDCGGNGQCIGGVCVCAKGYTGEDCSQTDCLNNCLSRGKCVDGECVCEEPWTGYDCSELICPNDCYDRGRCVNGTCYCEEGFTGEDCREKTCPSDCLGNGFCVDGQCVCSSGYTGEDCSKLTCPSDCNDRGVCFNGMCICNAGYQGEDCSQLACPNNCHNRGQCVNGQCVCNVGYQGEDCSELSCPNNCQDQGRCVDGKCICFEGFGRDDCSLKVCKVDCGGNGQCIGGVCVCAKGYTGEDCSQTDCLKNCLSRGKCVDGECVCEEPWTGYDCSELICPNDCYDHGRCVNGTCYCEEGFTGEDCGEKTCPSDCLGNGFCVDGQCVCSAGYTGEDCSKLTCPSDCNDRGVCFNGMCICNAGYQGEDCSQLACPNNCHNRGQCVNGQCVCNVGYQGEDCSELSCPNNCLNRGRCVNGQCVCDERFGGEDCSIKICPSDCYGSGNCVDGRCVCYAGFTGEDCSKLSCPNNCLNRGRCVDGQCVCDEGFTGEDCTEKHCPNDCLDRGYCVDGKCVCLEGYAGVDCSELTCPDNCNNRGHCVNGKCMCEERYMGDNCGELSCLNNCQDMGRCVNGQCLCDEGYIGEDCSEVSPPKDLTVTEVTTETVDLTWNNEMLVTEYLIAYVPTSPGGLYQEFRVPGDKTAATVSELEPGIEYLINVYAILSNKKSIPISARVATNLPEPDGLKFKSVRDTSVEVLWDQLDIPFDAWELYVRNTKEENGKILTTLPSSQNMYEQSGLGPGQEYEVSVGVIKNNTRGPQSTKIITTRIDGPRQVEVRDVTDCSGLVTWFQPVAQVDGVTVSYGPSSHPTERTSVDLSTSDKQYSIDSLSPDTEYQVSLISRRGDTTSEPVSEIFTTDLDAPKDLQPLGQTDDSITLEWRNSRADVDSYRVKYSPISGDSHGEEVFSRGPGDNTQAIITGMKPGTEYGIGVTAVKNERESLPATTNAATDLDGPKDLAVSESTETSMTLVWRRPRAKITIYRLVYISRDGQREEVEVPGTATTYVLTNLTPGMLYTITLVAERGSKKSTPVTLSASTDLDAPKDLQPLGQTDDSITLEWRNSRADVDSYMVKYSPISGDSHGEEVFPRGSGDNTQATITGMKPGTEYKIDVTAVKNERESLPATTNAATDLDGPRDLEVSESTETSMTLVWRRPRAKITIYRLVYISRDGQREEVEVPGTATTYVLTNLTPGMLYTITLVAERGSKKSTPVTLSASTGLGAPRGIRFSEVTESSAIVHWTMPRARVDSYRIIYVPLQGGSPMTVLADGTETQALLPNMLPGVTYQVTIFSMKDLEESDPGTDTITTALDRPQGLSAVNVTDTTALLLWQPTRATVDGYVITYSADSVSPVMEHVSGNTVEFEMGSLVPATHYTVGVYAMREALKSGTTTTEFTTDVDSPRDLAASNVQTDSATLTWKPPRADITGYVLTFTSSDSTVREVVLSPTATSYSMTQLSGTTDYNVRLQAIAGAQRSRHVTTVFTTIGVLYRYPKDCSQALLNGDTTSGIYTIYLGGEESQPIQVYCDMTTDGGGWMVFLRRQSGKLEFFRNWKNYTGGFGDINAEFWFGLANLHKMTTAGQYELRVDLRDNGESAYAQYDKFTIAEPRSRYKIHVGGFSGTAGDSMTYHQGRPFSTYDNDNDIAVTNCALSYKGAFWYKNCHRVNLMGRYGDDSHSKGINWFHWKGHEHSIQFAEMKIRPVNFRNFESRRKRS